MSGSWSPIFCSVLLDTEDSSVGSRLLIMFLGEERDQISADEHPRDHETEERRRCRLVRPGGSPTKGWPVFPTFSARAARVRPGARLSPPTAGWCTVSAGPGRCRRSPWNARQLSPGVDRGSRGCAAHVAC